VAIINCLSEPPKSATQKAIEESFRLLLSGDESEVMSAVTNLAGLPDYQVRTNKKTFSRFERCGSLLQKAVARLLTERLGVGR